MKQTQLLSFISFFFFCLGSLTSCVGRTEVNQFHVISGIKEVQKNGVFLFPAKSHSFFDVINDIDLKGQTYKLPENVTIRQKSGVIKNGTLIGNNTKIVSKGAIFERVSIQGEWNVESVSTNLFRDLSCHNSLRDVLALASPKVKNIVTIENGDYIISLDGNNQVGITVPSNTVLILNGNLHLLPNNLKYYEIVNLKGSNITISGKGSIVGDKQQHTGIEGEWGMGIYVRGTNITVRDITVKNCWGDCIYVGSKSRNVHIEKCLLDNGRRQGISITSARNVYINDCKIINVHGTAPQFAIDMEPNKGDTVSNIYIHNVKIHNCIGGISAIGIAKSSYLGEIYIDDCEVDEKTKAHSFQFSYTNKVSMKNCIARNPKKKIQFVNVNIVETKRNKVGIAYDMESYKNCKTVNGRRQSIKL